MKHRRISLLPFFLLVSVNLAVPGTSVLSRLGEGGNGQLKVRVTALHPFSPFRAQSARDSAALELSWGRAWHATRLLRQAIGEISEADPEEVLMLAEAEAGWGNWPAVAELLEPRVSGDLAESGRAWFLLGQTHEKGNDLQEAEAAFTRFLALKEGEGAPAVTLNQEARGLLGRLSLLGLERELRGDQRQQLQVQRPLQGCLPLHHGQGNLPAGHALVRGAPDSGQGKCPRFRRRKHRLTAQR